MPRAPFAVLAAALALVTAPAGGCLTRAGVEPGGEAPKALFQWPERPGRSEAKDEPANGGDAPGDEGKPPGEEPLTTERPDFTNSSRTVGKGRVQLESGYTFTTDRDPVARVTSHSYPEALLRIGLLTDWFEIQVGQNALSTRTAGTDGLARASGLQDLYLATKFALTEQSGWRPETAVTLQMSVPTAPRALSSGKVLPGLLYLYSWELVPDQISLGGSSVITGAVDGTGTTYVQLAQSLSLGYTLTDRLGAYTEWFMIAPAGADEPGVLPQHYFNSGLLYRVTPNFQLDARFGFGLNRAAADMFAGVGFAVRY